jgi:hypothetical protein
LFLKKQKKHTTIEVFFPSYLFDHFVFEDLSLVNDYAFIGFFILGNFHLDKNAFSKKVLEFLFSTQSGYFNETLWKLHKGLSNLRSHIVGLKHTLNNGLTSSLFKSKNV